MYFSLMYNELSEYIFTFSIQIFSFLLECATCFDVDLDVLDFYDIFSANSLFYFQNVLIFVNL